VPIHLVFGEEIFPSFFVQAPFLVLLAFASFGLAARLASPLWGLLAALIVMSIPEMTNWARTFHFAVPAAALFTAATYALVRSEGLVDRRWVLAWGLLLGLTLLARTMMIALVPSLVLAAMLTVAFAPSLRPRRAVNFVLALVTGLVIAATWYGRNWPIVAEYLFSYGYGDKSAYHGQAYPMLSWAYWSARLNTIIDFGFYLPLAVLVAATLTVGTVQILQQARGTGRIGVALRSTLQEGVWICVVVVVSGYLALTSSRNIGTGFALPLLPILVALSTAALARFRSRAVRACLVTAFVLVSLFNVVMKADVVLALSGTWRVQLSGLGGVRVIDGRGDIQRLLAYAGNDVGHPTAKMPEVHKQWLVLGRDVAIWLNRFADQHQRQPVVIFGSKDPFFNTNLIGLSARLHLRKGLWVGQLEPTLGGDDTEAYRIQLADPNRGPPNLVVTTDRGPSEYEPVVTQALVEEAARSLGFNQVGSFHLPDGRKTRIWWLDRGPRP
jgi:Dolichyl-phosphate-mannose-protein mannosyltransferase